MNLHNAMDSFVRSRLLNTHLATIAENRSKITLIVKKIESTERAIEKAIDDYINDCFCVASSMYEDRANITEIIYGGDVNLGYPGEQRYPSLIASYSLFSSKVKEHFPQCLIIKRFLFSGDDSIVSHAQDFFVEQNQRWNGSPIIIDHFSNKSFSDLYEKISQINSGIVDASLRCYQAIKGYHALEIEDEDYLESLRENKYLLFLEDEYRELTNIFDSINRSTSSLLSFTLSYLVPDFLRDSIIALRGIEPGEFSVMLFGALSHEDIANEFKKETETILQDLVRYCEISENLSQKILLLKEKLQQQNLRQNEGLDDSMLRSTDEGSIVTVVERFFDLWEAERIRVIELKQKFKHLHQCACNFYDETQRLFSSPENPTKPMKRIYVSQSSFFPDISAKSVEETPPKSIVPAESTVIPHSVETFFFEPPPTLEKSTVTPDGSVSTGCVFF